MVRACAWVMPTRTGTRSAVSAPHSCGSWRAEARRSQRAGHQGWIARNPDRATALLNENASYVFFREIDAKLAGPLGSPGVPLTAERLIAVDTRFIRSARRSGWRRPNTETSAAESPDVLRRTLAVPFGGVVRADFHWGTGSQGWRAGWLHAAERTDVRPKGSLPPAAHPRSGLPRPHLACAAVRPRQAAPTMGRMNTQRFEILDLWTRC